MRKAARLFLVLVLTLDVVIATLMLTGGTTQIFAQDAPNPSTGSRSASSGQAELEPAVPPVPVQTRWTREALQLLGRELTARAEELNQRHLELEETARGVEVLKRTAVNGEIPEGRGAGEGAPANQTRPALDLAARQELFTRLRKTYENMEPESAAAALSQLAVLDKGAVVELILGWKPRVAGAVLDSLTLSDPGLAADLSYGIWLRSGKNGSDVGSAP